MARLALAACLLALAALVVVGAGAGPGGALGSLFGFGDGKAVHGTAVAHRIAPRPVDGTALPVAVRRRIIQRAKQHRSSPAPRSAPQRQPGAEQAPAPGAGPQTPAPPPAPSPQPAPAPSPAPSPAPPGVVGGATDTVKHAAQPLPAPVQPIVGQAVDTVTRICSVLGGCP